MLPLATLRHMADIRIGFGRAVRKLRLAKGQSQEAFAASARINRSYMGQIERGEVNISIDSIEKIAKALGITPGVLMLEVDAQT
jgi:transcriptional regulator with XRE-family HTH domain